MQAPSAPSANQAHVLQFPPYPKAPHNLHRHLVLVAPSPSPSRGICQTGYENASAPAESIPIC
eukprot:4751594-Pleurochrysis_carterae.AAC.1